MCHGRPNGCGSWRPEDKKLIYGMKEKNVRAHSRLPSPLI